MKREAAPGSADAAEAAADDDGGVDDGIDDYRGSATKVSRLQTHELWGKCMLGVRHCCASPGPRLAPCARARHAAGGSVA